MGRPLSQPSCAKLHLDHFSILFISHWSFLSKAPRSHAEIGQKKTNRGRDGESTIPKRKFAIKMICISFIRHSRQIVLVVGLIPIMCPRRKLSCRRMVFVHPNMSRVADPHQTGSGKGSVQIDLGWNHRVHILVEMKQGQCICPLSWSVHSNFSGEGKCNERGWACTPHPHQPGQILPSSLNVRQKAAVATLCTLWLEPSTSVSKNIK
jgi:hypothetical protein